MEFLAECIECHLDILDDRVTIGLVIKGILASSLDGVLEQVVKSTNAGGLALFNQLLAATPHQQGLHVTAGLGEVEQFPAIG